LEQNSKEAQTQFENAPQVTFDPIQMENNIGREEKIPKIVEKKKKCKSI